MLGLVLADFLRREDVFDIHCPRVELVLVDAAVPGLGNHPVRADTAIMEVIIDEGSQFTGVGFHGMHRHSRTPGADAVSGSGAADRLLFL